MSDDTPNCPKGTILLSHDLAIKPLPAWCNRWRCQRCGRVKAWKLRKRLELTRPARFITLTLRPDPALTAAEQLAIANRAWSILWRRYRRRFGDRAAGYAKIVELTKAGTPHLHILASVPFIHQSQLAADWRQLTGSFVVDIRAVNHKRGIAGYLTSYLTKALAVPPGMRKWSASRDYVPEAPRQPLEEDELAPCVAYRHSTLLKTIAAYLAGGWTYSGDWLLPPNWGPPPATPTQSRIRPAPHVLHPSGG